MTKSMSLLTILRHTPQAHSHLTSITTMFIVSYVKKKRPKEGLKVYRWMHRPGSPCKVEKTVYELLINGFCQLGLVLEGLKILRNMLAVGFVPGDGLKRRVYRSLLRDARVGEALGLNEALCACFEDDNAEGGRRVRELLDSIIDNWTE